MKKNLMKNLVAGFAAMSMVMGMGMVADAATITISNAVNGQTYTAYKVFEVSKSTDGTAVSYYLTADQYQSYGSDLENSGVVFKKSSDGTRYYVDGSSITNVNAASLATALNGIKGKLSSAGTSGAVTTTGENTNRGTTSIEVSDAGYYFVDSSMGAVCALLDADAEFTLIEKNEEPTIEKTSSDSQDVSYNIGDNVPFKIEINAGGSADTSYIVTDTMTAGLTLNQDSITITPDEAGNYAKTEYLENGFKITFDQAYTSRLSADDKITINYTAKLNQNAVVADTDGNTNDVDLQYGDSHTISTEKTHVDISTGSVTVTKYGNNDKNNLLDGAQFVILNGDGTKYLVNDWQTNTYQDGTEDWALVPQNWNTVPDNALILTTADGIAKAEGIAAGEYQLLEVAAPDGYNKLDETVSFTISNDTDTNLAAKPEVNNNSGSVLPSTGGMGTTIFYGAGAVLAIGAGVILVTRKRMSR